MKNYPELLSQNLGVDVSKDTLDVAFSTIDMQQQVKVKASRKFANSPVGFDQLQKWMESKRVKDLELRILMEATGILQQLYGVIESEKYTGGCVAITSYSRRVQLFQGHNQAQIDSS